MSIRSTSFTPSSDFYVIGGTLRRDAPSYVPRRADEELFRRLAAGELCYVLTSRQMGKSSLMVRTAVRLRGDGDAAVVLDLTEVGQNLTAEQWYKGLLGTTAEQLELDDELADFWRERRDIGPMQRWLRALQEVALPRVSGRLVVFIDEIDAVRSLPFSTDELFAGIRESYNRRPAAPELERLTFCLLGVASPSDLIRDTRTTPFNIGHRIELSDFTNEEAAPLERGLTGRPDERGALLGRILEWTGGHPYLTQRLCQAVAEDGDVRTPAEVDRSCDELFLSRRARERDDNLLFVRDRMLRSEADLPELLDLYRRVRAGQTVADDEANPLVSVLKLAGIVSVAAGRLRVRNRIYAHVFDDAWIHERMPGAEVRRQRKAFTSGAMRAFGVSLVVLALMSVLVADAWRSRNRAEEQRRIAETERATNARLLYVAHMNLAYQALDRGDFVRVAQLLDDEARTPDRGFEFYYLWHLTHAEAQTIFADDAVIDVEYAPDGATIAAATRSSIAIYDATTGLERVRIQNGSDDGGFCLNFSNDGRILTAASSDGSFRTFDAASGALLHDLEIDRAGVHMFAVTPAGHPGPALVASGEVTGRLRFNETETGALRRTIETGEGPVNAGVFSADGGFLASGHANGTIAIWDVATGRRVSTLRNKRQFVWAITFSPAGGVLATAESDGSVALVDVATGRERSKIKGPGGTVDNIRFARDGQRIALGFLGRVEIRGLDGALLASHPGHRDQILDIDFSPDGSHVVSGGIDQTIRTWEATPATNGADVLTGHTQSVYAVAYAPDGSSIATGSFDGTAALWDRAGHRLREFRGHTDYVHAVAFSPDGRLLATGSADTTARVWDVSTGQLVATIEGFRERIFTLAFSPDGSRLAVGCFDGSIRMWSVARHADLATFWIEPRESVECVAFSRDGSVLAAGGQSERIDLFDAASGAVLGRLEGHADWVDSLAFSPDGTLLATAGSYSDTTVVVWDVASRQPIYRLKGFSGASGFSASSTMGPTGRANCVRFSPDGLTLAVGTTDRTIKLFDVRTGQELSTILTPHPTQIYALAFAPDGSELATASEDGTVRLWRAASQQAVAAYAAAEQAAPTSKPTHHVKKG